MTNPTSPGIYRVTLKTAHPVTVGEYLETLNFLQWTGRDWLHAGGWPVDADRVSGWQAMPEPAPVHYDDAESYLQSKDVWHHPRVTNRTDSDSFCVAGLMADFAEQVKTQDPNDLPALLRRFKSYLFREYQRSISHRMIDEFLEGEGLG